MVSSWEKKMKQANSTIDKANSKKLKVAFFFLIPLILLLILLTGITVTGLHSDASALIAIIAVLILLISTWTIYFSIRYLQISAWRWIAGGFKGKPDFPHTRLALRTSKDTKHYNEMSRIERISMLFSWLCTLSGMVLLFIGVSWFLVLDITRKGTVGSSALTLFWVGAVVFFLGFFINYISTRKANKRGGRMVRE
jgi:small-conductance mechanosensitive channel